MAHEHPPLEELVLYAESELTPTQMATVRGHLAGCAECRRTIHEVDSTVESFRDREISELRTVAAPEWQSFSKVLGDADREDARVALPVHRWARWVAAIVVIVGLSALANQFTPRLDARTLVARSVTVERQGAHAGGEVGIRVSGPLAHSLPCAAAAKMRGGGRAIASGRADGDASPIAEWSSPQSGWQDDDLTLPPLDRPADLCSNVVLSARSFHAWLATQQKPSETVTENEGLTILSFESGDGLLRRATLTIRSHTFQPVAQRLAFADGSQVELWLLEGTSVETLVAPPVSEPTVANAPKPIAPSSAMPTALVLDQGAELDVRLKLHGVGADLGEDVTVMRRPDGKIEVAGTVQTAARRRELASALLGSGGVVLSVQAAEDRHPLATAPVAAAPVVSEPAILDSWLHDAFPSASSRDAYVARAITLADSLLSRTVALATLADRYGPATVATLSSHGRTVLDEMVSAHQAGLRTAVSDLAAHVAPLGGGAAVPNDEGTRPSVTLDGGTTRGPEASDASRLWQDGAPADVCAARRVGSAVLELLTTHDVRVSKALSHPATSTRGGACADSSVQASTPLERLHADLRQLGPK